MQKKEERSALWSGTNKNRDVNTGPIARPFALSLTPLTRLVAPDCSLHSRPLLRSLIRSLAHFADSRAHGKVNYWCLKMTWICPTMEWCWCLKTGVSMEEERRPFLMQKPKQLCQMEENDLSSDEGKYLELWIMGEGEDSGYYERS